MGPALTRGGQPDPDGPKSVVASGHGLVSAQNDGTLAATSCTSQGAPVEAAYTADGRHADAATATGEAVGEAWR